MGQSAGFIHLLSHEWPTHRGAEVVHVMHRADHASFRTIQLDTGKTTIGLQSVCFRPWFVRLDEVLSIYSRFNLTIPVQSSEGGGRDGLWLMSFTCFLEAMTPLGRMPWKL